MSPRPTSHNQILSRLALIVALVVVLVSCNSSFAAGAPTTPKIGRVEIGFKNHFKVGFWTPVRIEIEGASGTGTQQVDVTVADNDGVPTTASEPVKTSATNGSATSVTIYTKVGRVGSPLRITLFDGERRLDEQTLRPDAKAKPNSTAIALPATAELIVSLESAASGLRDAFPTRESEGNQPARQVVEISQISDLPTHWWGYDGADVLAISAADGKLCRDLAADTPRLAALTRWVELGGRLVIQCDGNTGKELLAPGGPLARFAPGSLAEAVRLPETGPLEHFAGSSTPISIAPGDVLRVLRFVDVQGVIETHAGKKSTDLPLVVRSPFGLGEVTFSAVDFSQPLVANWVGRPAFLQAMLRPYLTTPGGPGDASQRLVTRGYNDLTGALRQRLGMSFTSVMPISFAVVAILALLYIAFLGPIDYLFVNRWIRKPLVAWITFPLLVLAFCGAAMSLAAWRNGGRAPRVNRMELVDVDTTSGLTRGTLWSVIYSPAAARFDLSVEGPRLPVEATGEEALLSWWGLPGTGIGGMQAGGMDLGIVADGYRYSADRRSLLGVPVLTSATKSLLARWMAQAPAMIQSELVDQDELATGAIADNTKVTLKNVRLLYGSWAYRLGDIGPGKRAEVGEQLSPRKVKTIVTHDALGESAAAKGTKEGKLFVPETASADEILRLMMFYDAAGGVGFAHLPNRFLASSDLSRTLELGRAILVADAPGPVAQLSDGESNPQVTDNQDGSTVIYRFVLPVKRQTGS